MESRQCFWILTIEACYRSFWPVPCANLRSNSVAKRSIIFLVSSMITCILVSTTFSNSSRWEELVGILEAELMTDDVNWLVVLRDSSILLVLSWRFLIFSVSMWISLEITVCTLLLLRPYYEFWRRTTLLLILLCSVATKDSSSSNTTMFKLFRSIFVMLKYSLY